MKCPLLAIGYLAVGDVKVNKKCECLKEVCAWWLDDIQMCSIRELALELRHTQFHLQDITAKMPVTKE